MTNQLKRTPLFEEYAKYGGKTIDFGGWELPVQFSSIKEEHDAVRNRAGLFDVSHMGEIFVEGADALNYLQNLLSNDISKIAIGGAQYNAMCYENGGVVDDLLVYYLKENSYLLCVNAANIEKDFEWMKKHVQGDVTVTNKSNEYAQIALQGPLSEEILQTLTDTNLSEIKTFKFIENVNVGGHDVLVSRTGYTGEDGFELYGAPVAIVDLWNKILDAGKEKGVVPAGLGARDTLRFEACLPLYGQELSQDITPLEAGIGFAVKLQKESDFIGKDALKAQKENGLPRKIVGVEMIDKGIPRHGYKVFKDGAEIGEITTGTQSPLTKRNIGLALIDSKLTELGTEVEIEIRNKKVKAIIVATPFYKRSK
ncbi:glycine cleavage system aminomethyltransferase GcvT [Lysinibacillus sp. BW-2-10]|uniref:glycine cleavage system aminomethyltransferase GcvT n=1 Tax=Lysinibacillus sp. BW-2-10 TaxID=2590030 RepID=UPI00117CADF5|nr:glycine cleavage system aminomethyltransferase GcvT [Lysinibacillus sp. BW-2-10]TSI08556.1 glycine cleavage system aminomethyltransferase GcvT [Lysinibacillus sp. BW-2-10]